MELSDEQKAHIRAEEIFREAVRREPKPGSATDSLTTKIIKWFNQPLGIWFLSAVLVTGISEAHKSYQSRQAKVKSEIEVTDGNSASTVGAHSKTGRRNRNASEQS